MTDEPEFQESPVPGVFFVNPEALDRHRAAHDVVAHDVNRMLHELSQEHLAAVSTIIDGIAMSDHPTRQASYMAGKITSIMEARFNVCGACGKNHDEAAQMLLNTPPPAPPHVEARRIRESVEKLKRQGTVDPADEITMDEPTGKVTEGKVDNQVPTQIGSQAPVKYWEQEIMDLYNIDDVRDEATGKLLHFMCKGCGIHVSSINDRTLSPPGVEGCSGCQQKAKFG